jgi:hypothetical protein
MLVSGWKPSVHTLKPAWLRSTTATKRKRRVDSTASKPLDVLFNLGQRTLKFYLILFYSVYTLHTHLGFHRRFLGGKPLHTPIHHFASASLPRILIHLFQFDMCLCYQMICYAPRGFSTAYRHWTGNDGRPYLFFNSSCVRYLFATRLIPLLPFFFYPSLSHTSILSFYVH